MQDARRTAKDGWVGNTRGPGEGTGGRIRKRLSGEREGRGQESEERRGGRRQVEFVQQVRVGGADYRDGAWAGTCGLVGDSREDEVAGTRYGRAARRVLQVPVGLGGAVVQGCGHLCGGGPVQRSGTNICCGAPGDELVPPPGVYALQYTCFFTAASSKQGTEPGQMGGVAHVDARFTGVHGVGAWAAERAKSVADGMGCAVMRVHAM